MCTPMFITALFTITQIGKPPMFFTTVATTKGQINPFDLPKFELERV